MFHSKGVDRTRIVVQKRGKISLNDERLLRRLSGSQHLAISGGPHRRQSVLRGTQVAGSNPHKATAHGLEIVLYKDRSLVAWDSNNRVLRLQVLDPQTASTLVRETTAECPLCGQAVHLTNFSFEARAYFKILQEAIISWNKQRRQDRTCHSPSKIPLPSGESTSTNPFTAPGSESQDLRNIPRQLIVNDYYETFFTEGRKLGSGSFGQVYLCQHRLDDLILGSYAVKKIPVGDSKEWLQKMLKEVKVRESLHHQNIVSYKHSWLEMSSANEFSPRVPWLFVLMEFCDAGDLEEMITNETAPLLTDRQVWTLFFDIVSGLQHLHHAGILHRDLKPSNILLRRDDAHEDSSDIHALLADFGTAEFIKEKKERTGQGYTGTVGYTAPELLVTDAAGRYTASYDFKSDMWSLGLILHFIAYGKTPFEESEQPPIVRQRLLDFVREMTIQGQSIGPDRIPLEPSDITRSLEMRQLIAALISSDPSTRPSCDDILTNSFIREQMEQSSRTSRGSLASCVRGGGGL